MSKYPTAFCKTCGKPIYNSKGEVDKKGFWICVECKSGKKEDRAEMYLAARMGPCLHDIIESVLETKEEEVK